MADPWRWPHEDAQHEVAAEPPTVSGQWAAIPASAWDPGEIPGDPTVWDPEESPATRGAPRHARAHRKVSPFVLALLSGACGFLLALLLIAAIAVAYIGAASDPASTLPGARTIREVLPS